MLQHNAIGSVQFHSRHDTKSVASLIPWEDNSNRYQFLPLTSAGSLPELLDQFFTYLSDKPIGS